MLAANDCELRLCHAQRVNQTGTGDLRVDQRRDRTQAIRRRQREKIVGAVVHQDREGVAGTDPTGLELTRDLIHASVHLCETQPLILIRDAEPVRVAAREHAIADENTVFQTNELTAEAVN